MVIYVDVLLIVNFIITYYLLLSASLLSGYTHNKKRVIISSATGAIFCLYIFVDINSSFADIAFKIISLFICSVIAFGIKDKKKLAIQMLCYLFLNTMLSGLIYLLSQKSTAIYQNNLFYYFSINPVLLVVSAMVIYLSIMIFELVKDKVSPQKTISMDIFFDSFSITDLSAFHDSGFKLKDIISNKDIVIVSLEKTKEKLPYMLTEDIAYFLKGNYTDVKTAFTPVFFNTLSGSGILPALKCSCILAEGKRIKNILVAFTDNQLSENVEAIFGNDIKKQL